MSDEGKQRFQAIMGRPEPDQGDAPSPALLEPLHDLAEALEEAGVGVAVEANDRRVNLVLWPQFRPARRSIMLTLAIVNGGLEAVVRDARIPLTAPDGVRSFLETFVGGANFRASIQYLRDEASWHVEGVLRGEGGALLLDIEPDQQRAMAGAAGEIEMELELDESETVPEGFHASLLDSAGIRFAVRNLVIIGRAVLLELTRLS